MIVLSSQRASDHYPFVIAGRYTSAQIGGNGKIILWTHKPQEAAELRGASDALARTMAAYESAFGAHSKDSSTTWIVESPVAARSVTNLTATTAKLLGDEKESGAAERVSLDTMLVARSGGTP